jgi:hypothetical protein
MNVATQLKAIKNKSRLRLPAKGNTLSLNPDVLRTPKGKKRTTLGGTKGTGHAKRARPLAPRTSYHIVLRSGKARGPYSLLNKKHKHLVSKLIHRQAKRFFVRVESYANVGNHLHLKAYAQGTEEFRNFLRTINCLVARVVTGARRGHKFGRFWDGLTFTRLLRSITEHEILERYIFANILQADCGPSARLGYLQLWYLPDRYKNTA